MNDVTEAVDNDFEVIPRYQQQRGQADGDTLPTNEKDSTRENNVAKIKVVVYSLFCYTCICLQITWSEHCGDPIAFDELHCDTQP